MENLSLDDLLDEISVLAPGQWENEMESTALGEWWAVTDEDGIIAYFGSESHACFFRLGLINSRLNPTS